MNFSLKRKRSDLEAGNNCVFGMDRLGLVPPLLTGQADHDCLHVSGLAFWLTFCQVILTNK